MKKALSFVVSIATIFLFCAPYLYADNVQHLMSIDNALKKNNHLLNSNIKLSFSSQIEESDIEGKLKKLQELLYESLITQEDYDKKKNELQEKIIQDKGFFVSNKKANGFLKKFQSSCTRAFLSAIISLQDRAVKEGGNAVINIHSFYEQKEMFSEEVFECHKGSFVTGVALRGRVVRIDN